jgi:hypothetical protein
VYAVGLVLFLCFIADLILHNGQILTVDRNFSTQQAVAKAVPSFPA